MSDIVVYCPECKAEYREGFSVCSDCEVPLVRRLESEMGDRLVPLTRESSFEFVAELLDRLEKNEVPYVVQAGTALEFLDGKAVEVARVQPWEARVWIAASREGVAREILDRVADEWSAARGTEPAKRHLEWPTSR